MNAVFIQRKHNKHNINLKQKPYLLCDYDGCNKFFSSLEWYNKHRKNHFKSFECSICNKKFRDDHSLKIHKRIHGDLREEKCKFCGNSFKDQRTLKKHINYIHQNGNQYKPFICKKCNKSFSRKDSLTKHWKTHQKNRKIYECNQCPSTFISKPNYNKHQRVYHC